MVKNVLIKINLFCVLLSFVFSSQKIFPTDIHFKHVTIENGLSQNTVYTTLQDSKGFLWFGTQDGLNKYDGYKFTIYNQDLVNKNRLSDRQVHCLFEDKSGIIWIGTYDGGLNSYDPKSDQFKSYKFSKENTQNINCNRITSIIGNPNSNENSIWIGTLGGGVFKLTMNNSGDTRYEHLKLNTGNHDRLENNKVQSLYLNKKGILWIGTIGDGLIRFNTKTKQIKRYINFNNIPGSENIICIQEGSTGNLWIGTDGAGLIKFNPLNEQFSVYRNIKGNSNSISDNRILCISNLKSGSNKYLLIGTNGGGLNIFDIINDSFTTYKHDLDNDNSLNHNNVHSILIEKSGQIWIGTGAGISFYDHQSYNFKHYKHITGNSNSLSHEYIWAIFESRDGMLWIGTDNGLNQFDRENNKYKHIFHNPKNSNSLSHNEVMAVHEDREGILWIGTWHGGLNRYDRKRNSFKHFLNKPGDPNSLSDNKVRLIYEDPDSGGNILWLGTKSGGLNKFNIKTESFTHYRHEQKNQHSISDNSILSILRDSNNELWVGTWGGGLNRFDEAEQRFIQFKHDPDNPNSISHNTASMIYEDNSGNLWIGTHGGGLNKFDRETKIFTHYSIKDGLPNEVIYGILEDEDGCLWISTNKGLSRFNPKLKGKEAFYNFDVNDGLQSNEFNNRSFFKNDDGEMYFGGVNGFNCFYPSEIKSNQYVPPVVITDFKVFNKSLVVNPDSALKKSITYTNEILLDYDQSVFSIEFSALNFTNPEKNQYKYKLEGFDKDWSVINSDQRIVTYTNLDPGDYVFKVKGSNNAGIWNEIGTSLKITILPPFWLTWWFRISALGIIIGVFITGHRERINIIKKQKQILETEVHNRTVELKSQKEQLENALSQVKQLTGLLPICASCKKIRDDKGYWNQIETYISQHSEANFSHGICPDCYKDLYPELYKSKQFQNK